MADTKRRLYQAAYRTDLEDQTTQLNEPGSPDGGNSNTSNDGLTPEEGSWKKRYGDLRSHSNSLTERIKTLELQLASAQKKDFQMPSTQAELQEFTARYPDVVRHMRSLAMQELLQERQNLVTEKQQQEQSLEQVKRELGYNKILSAHPDFEQVNLSEQFHEWAQLQPKQIQDWLFESTDPALCIKALDLYKAEMNFKAKPATRPAAKGADTLVANRSTIELTTDGGKRIWKASEIQKMHPKDFEKYEDAIELARTEGRIDLYA